MLASAGFVLSPALAQATQAPTSTPAAPAATTTTTTAPAATSVAPATTTTTTATGVPAAPAAAQTTTTTTAAATPSTPAEIAVGDTVNDPQGAKVGTVTATNGDLITVSTPNAKAQLPKKAFARADTGLVIGMTAAQLEAAAKAAGGAKGAAN
jgi:hypothetical protein